MRCPHSSPIHPTLGQVKAAPITPGQTVPRHGSILCLFGAPVPAGIDSVSRSVENNPGCMDNCQRSLAASFWFRSQQSFWPHVSSATLTHPFMLEVLQLRRKQAGTECPESQKTDLRGTPVVTVSWTRAPRIGPTFDVLPLFPDRPSAVGLTAQNDNTHVAPTSCTNYEIIQSSRNQRELSCARQMNRQPWYYKRFHFVLPGRTRRNAWTSRTNSAKSRLLGR